MKKITVYQRRGSILILTLWVLGVLTILCIQFSAMVRQTMILVGRIERRAQLRWAAEGGIRKAVALVHTHLSGASSGLTAPLKVWLHNNPRLFQNIEMQPVRAEVQYETTSEDGQKVIRYGLRDEESKLPINTTRVSELVTLFVHGFGLSDAAAEELAKSIIDWRQQGTSELVGFYSDEYYQNLQHPYPPKDADFEILDELLLVKGIRTEMLPLLTQYLTIYGEGKMNINTASPVVLYAAGLSEELVNKIVVVRRGPDGREATEDDYIFQKTYDIAGELDQLVGLEESEKAQINTLNTQQRLATTSQYFSIRSTAVSPESGEKKVIQCVFNTRDDKIEYWREE